MSSEDIPADMQAQADDLHEQLVEAAAEADDELMEKYLEEGALSIDDRSSRGLRKRTLANEIVVSACRFRL